MRGMVLAAGLGTRMRPVSETIPKPLVRSPASRSSPTLWRAWNGPVAIDIVVNTHHLAAQIETFLADHMDRPGAPRIHISREEERLETGGGVRRALPMARRRRVLCREQRCRLDRERHAGTATPGRGVGR